LSRYALGIEYDGSRYAGWQWQPNVSSVQAALQAALGRVADHPVEVTCGGRTDAGVHARGQVVHFDSPAVRAERGWALGANTHLPRDMAVLWVARVDADFNARYSALARRYRYLIVNRNCRPGLDHDRVCWIHQPLDEVAMHAAGQVLVGEHDFSAFRAAECQANSPIRRVARLTVARQGEWVWIDIEANAFLHHMVRNIAGLLISIGRGERSGDEVARILATRDRRLSAPTAAPEGIYLRAIEYPEAFGLPIRL
jgi:tRNA pseudouridine38-40 synthase